MNTQTSNASNAERQARHRHGVKAELREIKSAVESLTVAVLTALGSRDPISQPPAKDNQHV